MLFLLNRFDLYCQAPTEVMPCTVFLLLYAQVVLNKVAPNFALTKDIIQGKMWPALLHCNRPEWIKDVLTDISAANVCLSLLCIRK